MNTQFDYQQYQARRAEDRRKAEQARLAQQTNTEAFYSPALTQLGRSLVALGQRLQEQTESAPQSRKAYR